MSSSRAPWGLRPPGARAARREAATTPFMWNYAGGWQELFPSVNAACVYRGRRDPVPRRGRLAAVGARGARERGQRGARCGSGRGRARRRFCSSACSGSARARRTLAIEGTVVNESSEDGAFRLGAPLRRRAAVPRGRLPARDPGPHDRHLARALGARDGAARAAPPRAVAARAAADRRDGRSPRDPGPRDREPRRSLRDRARRRLARRLQSSARPDLPARMGSRRCSAGSCSGSPTAARSRRR